MLALLDHALTQIIILLATTVFVVLLFQRLRIPSSLAYLLVGILLGNHTTGPVISNEHIRGVAEFGIVFLLFTIGLNFTVSQIYAMRHTIFGLGTSQVVLTTAIVGAGAWALGMPAAAAFVIGAVFAQSSTTIISRQLAEQGESDTRHGRLGTAMSIFQDVTAVPFVIIIPVLGAAAASEVAASLGLALFKAVIATAAVLLAGRFLMRRFFQTVAQSRSAELFTLTVLFVSLTAAGITAGLGLSMAFGAFLAGMVLGETEFRHQVESTIRPFRDVLLGLFFVSIGMLVQPALIPTIWVEALLGAIALIAVKVLLVTALVRWSGVDSPTAFRTGLLLGVGGEFGFALLALGLGAALLDDLIAQTVLTAVLFSMVLAPFLIRYNRSLAAWLLRSRSVSTFQTPGTTLPEGLSGHVVICGFGRTGQMVARFLEVEKIPYVALDVDPQIVREASLAGQPVFYADSSDAGVLEAIGLGTAKLLVISHNDKGVALKTLGCVRQALLEVPALVRARDEGIADELRRAGATEVIPETLEAGMTIASHALLSLGLPMRKVTRLMLEQRARRYPMLRELFLGSEDLANEQANAPERLHSVRIDGQCPAVGQSVEALLAHRVLLSAIVRGDQRITHPADDLIIEPGDVLVILGTPENLTRAEQWLTGVP